MSKMIIQPGHNLTTSNAIFLTRWDDEKKNLEKHFHTALRWRHNERNGVSNHQPHDCLLNRLFRRRSKKTSKLRLTGLCEGNSPVTHEFPRQRASNAKNVLCIYIYRQTSNMSSTKSQNLIFLVSSCTCLCPINWSQVLSREQICSWSSADRR